MKVRARGPIGYCFPDRRFCGARKRSISAAIASFDRGVEPQRDECAYALGQRGEAGDARGVHRLQKRFARWVARRRADVHTSPGLMREPMLDQHQAVVAEEHLAVDEHRGRAETAARDQLLGVDPQLVLVLGAAIFLKNSSWSSPAARTMSRRTSSRLTSRSSPQ